MHRLKKSRVILLCLLFLTGVLADQSVAQDKAALKRQARSRAVSSSAAQGAPAQILDINNMTTWVRKDGFFDWMDPTTGEGWNGTFPKGTTGAVFAQGTLWGGLLVEPGKDPVVRVNGYTYADGMDAGKILPIEGGKPTGPDDPDKYHVWRVRRNWRTMDYNASASAYYGVPLNAVTDAQRAQLREWYENDWNNWPADLGAPYEERNGQPGYQPATDANGNGTYEPEEGDIPGYPGADQTIWLVANDLRLAPQSYGSQPLGIEYQLTLWGYDFPSTSPLGNITFERARLIYRGTPTTPAGTRIDSMYVVKWGDVDVGDAGDDFAGSDTTLLLGYAYNANQIDATYANFSIPPPAIGWDFLQGPITADGDTLGMTSFVYFAAGSTISDPDLQEYNGSLQWYNLMRGVQPRPQYPAAVPFVNPLTNEPSKFTLTGDPVTAQGWIDGAELPPGDRRIVLTTGPFSLALGDTVDIVIGQVGGHGTSNLSSVTVLKYHDQFAQYAYDNNFVLPTPPPVPPVEVAELDGEIVLNWGGNLEEVARTENFNSNGFAFEGYNVYQLPASNAPLSEGVKLATFDLNNNVTVIQDKVVDDQTGFIIERPVQIGPDEGIKRYYRTSRDAIRGRPLANGVNYYFAITAYSYLPTADETVPFRQLESTPVVVTATPQPEKPGLAELPAPETALDVERVAGASTAPIVPQIVNPNTLQTANYEIRFAYYNPYTGAVSDSLAPGDTLTTVPADLAEVATYSADFALHEGSPFPIRWAAFRGDTQVSSWMPQIDPHGTVPASAAPIIEGVQVYVPITTLGIDHHEVENNTQRWLTWDNRFSLTGFNGAADMAPALLGSSTLTDDQYKAVRIEFEADTTDGWASDGTAFIRDSGSLAWIAANQGGKLPVAAYELNADGSKGRRLNVSFVELSACANGRWDFSVLRGAEDECFTDNAFREYLIVHASDYDGGAGYTTPADRTKDAAYVVVPALRPGFEYLGAEFALTFYPSIPPVPGDRYVYAVEAPATGVDSLLTASVDEINVFPNPYIGYSKLETSRSQKFVTFTHLPERATIRIFDLAGTIVRVIEHDSPSQFERWDLTNQDNVPVASGVYLVHVETEYGDKVLKVALVQEEQILQRY